MIFYKNTKAVANTAENLLKNSLISKLHVPLSSKKLIAFTLAEVLITLLIIGIVASLVVPALIQDTQNAELKTAWKKTYSDFSQATLRMVTDNGGSLKNVFISEDELKNQLSTYMNITKYCPNGSMLGSCWHLNNQFRNLNRTYPSWTNGTGFILNNLVLIVLDSRQSNCNGGTNNYCIKLKMDINGFKGPNMVGKDIFGFYIFKNSIKPWGYQGDTTYENTCSTNNSGWSCSAQYLYN